MKTLSGVSICRRFVRAYFRSLVAAKGKSLRLGSQSTVLISTMRQLHMDVLLILASATCGGLLSTIQVALCRRVFIGRQRLLVERRRGCC